MMKSRFGISLHLIEKESKNIDKTKATVLAF